MKKNISLLYGFSFFDQFMIVIAVWVPYLATQGISMRQFMELQAVFGHFLYETGDYDQALPMMLEGVRIGEAALAEHPGDQRLLAAVLWAYDNLLSGFERHSGAVSHLPRYVERAEQLARLQPQDDDAKPKRAAAR